MTVKSTDPAVGKSKNTYGVAIAAFLVPVLIVGQFAMLAIVPVGIVMFRSFRNAQLRPLRWWAGALGALYASALAMWAIGPVRAPSLSKDINPAVAGFISLAGVAVGVRYILLARKRKTVVQGAGGRTRGS